MNIDTPFKAYTTRIKNDWIDDNGHLNVAYYHLVFDLAAKPFFEWLGLTPDVRQTEKISTFALETHINFLSEVAVDAEVNVHARLLDVNSKRFLFYLEMFKTDGDTLAASYESLSTFVDMENRKSTSIAPQLLERMSLIKTRHSELELPWQIGHAISVNAKPPL